jgi:hypothetical protein
MDFSSSGVPVDLNADSFSRLSPAASAGAATLNASAVNIKVLIFAIVSSSQNTKFNSVIH